MKTHLIIGLILGMSIFIGRIIYLENENKELNSHLKYLTKENKELMRIADILGAEALRLIIKLEEQ